MAQRRLVPASAGARYSAEMSAALAGVDRKVRADLAGTLRAQGLTWDSPSRSVPNPVDPGVWQRAVDASLAPVAARLAADAWRSARGALPARAVAGAADPTETLVRLLLNQARQGIALVNRRVGAPGLTAAGIDVDAIRAKVMGAPSRYGGVVHPEAPPPSIADAYQAAFKQLDGLVQSSASHLGDAASTLLARSADQNGVSILHVWQTVGDDRVRDIHADMDGQTQGAGDPFEDGDGNLLYYPGDPDGPDESTCNCRCWLEALAADSVVELPDEVEADSA